MKQKFNVTGMTCSACSAHVEKAVNRLDGVQKAEVSLMTNSMTVQYDEDVLSPGGIIDAVIHAGYGASLPEAAATKTGSARPEARMEEELSAMKHRLIWSFVFLIPLFYISMGHMMGAPLPGFLLGPENAVAFGLTQLLLTLPIMYLNDKYYQVGFKTLLHRAPNMDSLIAVGSAAAVVYGVFAIYQMGYGLGHGDLELVARYHMDLYFESAGMILALITLGKFLETRSKGKTSQAITRLMDLAPKTAAVLRDGQEVEIPVEEVRVGDRIVVRPGQSIPVDGVIVEGSSAVDESALTGESLPVDKGPGDKVAAAAINRSGSFTFEASRVGEDTTLAQMIRLVEEASSSKAPISKLADKVAGVFVPTVMVIAAIAAGGWIAVLVIVIICLIGLLIGSCFGIFFSGEDSGSGYTMQNVVQEINDDYQQQIDTTKANLSHDVLEMSGSRAVWPDVLAVYAVKTTTDPDNPQEVATMDDSKKAILTDIFWEMNQISSRTETRTETVITETDDGNGNIVETETTVTQTYLYITVSHKTAEEMAEQYGFDEEQKEQLAELLAEENRSLWSAVLYGIYTEDGAIVSVALSQVGNVGGEPYWSWYGFSSRVEWCACFVSWCANECGYIDTGVIPKYAGCVNGVQWFKDRGQWMDGSAEPAPGMIIFFDWNDENGQDGLSDHTGIVEKVENGRVYTIEGNSGDSVRQNSYPVGHYEVLGYGCPDF